MIIVLALILMFLFCALGVFSEFDCHLKLFKVPEAQIPGIMNDLHITVIILMILMCVLLVLVPIFKNPKRWFMGFIPVALVFLVSYLVWAMTNPHFPWETLVLTLTPLAMGIEIMVKA